MTLCVCVVIVFLVITKLCDAVSTHQRLAHPEAETNPIARNMMHRLGTGKAIWAVMVLALVIIGLAGGAALRGGNIMKALFIIVGVFISIVQGAVAHCNWTGRDSRITKRVRDLHTKLRRILPR